ncbi:hypothetical protein [Amycolatopsis sp.]|uniref:hypothetical protein n=1 Tax=Amycolatopsis sp. TaxID=37632 RepID=UPI002D7ED131|nr:hypothetical protein [Amycolatopsis sp.]HET6703789.1 hypothetical protein [Amycolatopsis sp.]
MVMTFGGELLVLAAVLVMISFVAIPRRYRYWRLPAVVGWSLVWFDSRLTPALHDWIGLVIVVLTLVTVLVQSQRARRGDVGNKPGSLQ